MTIPKLSVIVPCFNEAENIPPLISLLEDALQGHEWEVVFVDDDSPDGTAEVVRSISAERSNVHLIHRIGRRGLSGACIEGMLSSRAELVAVMDGDLQHDETKLTDMLAAFAADPALDLCIGSRNVEGGSSGDGLSSIRKWGSDLATSFTRRMMKINASDPMSGFFMVRRQTFNSVVLNLQQQGFKILADMLSLSKGKWNVKEVPFTFRKRQHGQSKMDSAIAIELMALYVTRMTGGLFPIRFVLFSGVGASGVLVQYLATWALLNMAGWPTVLATIGAVIIAMTTNFWLNNALTYRDRALRGWKILRGLLSFYAICALGAVANVSIVSFVFEHTNQLGAATIAGAGIAAIWNFAFSSLTTWKTK